MLGNADLIRYSRQIRLREVGIGGQEKLKEARVLVIGAGGLGCAVLQYLNAAGIGHIAIVDHDVVDLTNLNRQVIYAEDEAGLAKPEMAARRLKLANPSTDFRVFHQRLTTGNALDIIRDYDLVADCTDNFPVRYLINDACVILGKPVAYGAVYQFEGQVTVFNYRGGPTLRCLQPEQPGPDEVPTCAEGGIIGTIAGIIGILQANEVIKMILDIGEVLTGRVMVFNALTCESHFFNLDRSPEASSLSSLGDYGEACVPGKANTGQITAGELKQWIASKRDFLIIDVSAPSDYIDHGLACIRVPYHQLDEIRENIQVDKPVVFVCPLGIQSSKVVNHLRESGRWLNLFSLVGGVMQFNK